VPSLVSLGGLSHEPHAVPPLGSAAAVVPGHGHRGRPWTQARTPQERAPGGSPNRLGYPGLVPLPCPSGQRPGRLPLGVCGSCDRRRRGAVSCRGVALCGHGEPPPRTRDSPRRPTTGLPPGWAINM